ncbi:MAG: DNRLRE domain-containing protein [Chthoniobacteraceae bacterium]
MPTARLFTAVVITALLAPLTRGDVLPPVQDTSSAKGKLTAAGGKATTLAVNATSKGFVLFDLGSLPDDVVAADIADARLRIYFPTVTKPGDIDLRTVSATGTLWNETAAANEPAVSGGVVATIPSAMVVGKKFVEVEVTATVRGWLTAPATNFGFAFLASGTTKVTLGAKEGTGNAYPCVLEVQVDRAFGTGNVAFAPGADRTLSVGDELTNATAGHALKIKAGSAIGFDFAQPGGDLILEAGSGFNQTEPNADGGDLILRSGANSSPTSANVDDGGDIVFQTGGVNSTFTERLRILERGNVGIGTSTPSSRLQVAGAVTAGAYLGTPGGALLLGTTDNQPMDFQVNGQRGLRLAFGDSGFGVTSVNVIGGFSGNTIPGNVPAGTIAGGGVAGSINQVTARAGTVGGGLGNTAAGLAVVAGGNTNTASGSESMIPGGTENVAAGVTSFAAGYRAKANHDGAFVWTDLSRGRLADAFASTADNQFNVRASGGTRIFSNGDATLGVSLAPNATSWGVLSDQNAKKHFAPVDGEAVLERLAAVPVQRWLYKSEPDDAVPHLGPMAQAFKAAFYPGRDDTVITTLEFDGVELAAIQGLHTRLKAKDAEIATLRAKLAEQATQLTEQARRADAIEARLARLEAQPAPAARTVKAVFAR